MLRRLLASIGHRGFFICGAVLFSVGIASAGQVGSPNKNGLLNVTLDPNRQAAASVLGTMKPHIPSGPESLEGRQSLSIDITKSGEFYRVEIISDGWMDDSVRGQLLVGLVEQTADGWQLKQLQERYICYRGEPDDKGRCP